MPSVLLVAVTLLAFAPVGKNGFFNLDDYEYVLRNSRVNSGVSIENTWWALTTYHAGNWHPLTWISLQVDVELFGVNPSAHHWMNVLFHLGAVLALFAALARMTGRIVPSTLVAAIFAVHPLRVESVAWIAERKDVLSAFFAMLTLLAYASYAKHPTFGRYAVTVALYALGLLAKPMLVTLPIVFLLLDSWPLARTGTSLVQIRFLEKLPFFGLAVVCGVLTIAAQRQGQLITSLEELPFAVRLAHAPVAYVRYLALTFWPVNLAVYYPHEGASLAWWHSAGSMAILALTTGLALGFRRSRGYLLVGWLWFLVMLVPVIGIVQVATQAVADRYTYLPTIGIYVMVVWTIADWCGGRPLKIILSATTAAAVVAGLAFLTNHQVTLWRDSRTLWEHTLSVTKGNFVARNNLGVELLNRGLAEQAFAQFEESRKLRPDLPGGHNGLGNVRLAQGRVDDAIAHFRDAIGADPRDANAHFYLATALMRKGRRAEAMSHYESALRVNPGLSDARFGLAVALNEEGKSEGALGHLERVIEEDPENVFAYLQAAEALARLGRRDEARAYLETARKVRPQLGSRIQALIDQLNSSAPASSGQGR